MRDRLLRGETSKIRASKSLYDTTIAHWKNLFN